MIIYSESLQTEYDTDKLEQYGYAIETNTGAKLFFTEAPTGNNIIAIDSAGNAYTITWISQQI